MGKKKYKTPNVFNETEMIITVSAIVTAGSALAATTVGKAAAAGLVAGATTKLTGDFSYVPKKQLAINYNE